MSDTTKAMQVYVNGLRIQHAVETQAIGTLRNELPRMTACPDLHARMRQDKDRSVAGFAHAPASDEVLKNVLASYTALVTLAEAAGAGDDVAILETLLGEEQERGDWLGTQLPSFVHAYLAHAA